MDSIGSIASSFAAGLPSSAGSLSSAWNSLAGEGDPLSLDGTSMAAGTDGVLTTGGSVAPAFGQVLSSFLQQVDGAQHHADAMVESLALGEPVDVHQVMLALNEAADAMHLTVQVRGKLLEAYQALMQTQL